MSTHTITPRVLHLNTADSWRGGERQVLNLALALRDQGTEQVIVAQPASELARRAAEQGLAVREVRMRGELDFFAPRRIAAVAREFSCNVLHAHTSGAHGLGLRVCRARSDISLVVSRRVDFPVARGFVSKLKYRSAVVRAYVAVSRRVGEVLIEGGVLPSKVYVVHSAIDPARYKERSDCDSLRVEFAIRPGEVILGNVAALVDHKDQQTLLRAVATIPAPGTPQPDGKAFPAWRLFILGEGELRGRLEKLSRELGLEQSGRVIFTGFRTDVLSFYDLFDIFVMSSKEEGLGTAVLDALYFGLPVAANAGGGIPEMIDEGNGGLLLPVGDSVGLGAALTQLILNPDQRKAMGAHNQSRARDFSMESVLRGTLAVYQGILQ